MAYTTIDDPSAYFQTKLYTGNSSTQSITFDGNTNMQPDWVWIKSRSATEWHQVHDSARGVAKYLFPNTDSAEGERSPNDQVTSFNSNGFSLGAGANDSVNSNGGSYASWNWKAGTSVSGNTTGSGTAKAYSGSVNTDAGFSIIKYVGNGTSAHTIPHHLGAVPQWVLIKETSNASDWMGYHIGIGNTHTIKLNEPDAPVDRTDWWNDTTPTSSVVTLGDNGEINQNDTNYIMYSFSQKQGYSKFGSYEGTNNANGTFVYTGFSVGWVMIKNIDAGSTAWVIQDSKRSSSGGGNPADKRLRANDSNAEETDSPVDLLSNGFKIRSTGSFTSDANTFIYMAFAENPFTTSTGVPATAR